MNPKQKALELMDKFYQLDNVSGYVAIQCAIIAVDEIIEAVKDVSYNEIYLDDRYWKKVKKELEKM